MLKNKTARQDRQCGAIDLLGMNRDHWHMKEIPDCAEEALFVHFTGIKDLAHPGTAI